MPKIIYVGPESEDDISTEVIVRDENGTPHTLRKGARRGTDVPEDLAKRLLGADAPKGHKFEAAPEADKSAESGGDTSGETTGDAATSGSTTDTASTAGKRKTTGAAGA